MREGGREGGREVETEIEGRVREGERKRRDNTKTRLTEKPPLHPPSELTTGLGRNNLSPIRANPLQQVSAQREGERGSQTTPPQTAVGVP